MRKKLSAGFIPAVLLVVFAALGVTSVGTAAAANNSRPGDLLFGLDKAFEEVRVAVATGDTNKARIRLQIVQERLAELSQLDTQNQPVDGAIVETQQALSNATSTLANVETKFKENKITLESQDLQGLLAQLQRLLVENQGLVRRVEIKIKDDKIKAKIKLFEQEASESAELIDDDLDDLQDDGQLNASPSQVLEVELKGLLQKVDSLYQLTSGSQTYTLSPFVGLDLESLVGKFIELKGFAKNETPDQVTVLKTELEDEEDENDEIEVKGPPEVEVKGTVQKVGGGFVLSLEGGKSTYALDSTKHNLDSLVGKFVKIEGSLSGNTLSVDEAEVKKTTSSGKPITPALSTSSSSGKTEDKKEDKEKKEEKKSDDKSGSSKDSGGSSGSSDSKDKSDKDDDD